MGNFFLKIVSFFSKPRSHKWFWFLIDVKSENNPHCWNRFFVAFGDLSEIHEPRALCAGNSPVTAEFPSHRPMTRSFDASFFICAWTNGWVNNRDASDLRRHCTHYDVTCKIWYFHKIICANFIFLTANFLDCSSCDVIGGVQYGDRRYEIGGIINFLIRANYKIISSQCYRNLRHW